MTINQLQKVIQREITKYSIISKDPDKYLIKDIKTISTIRNDVLNAIVNTTIRKNINVIDIFCEAEYCEYNHLVIDIEIRIDFKNTTAYSFLEVCEVLLGDEFELWDK